jgi:hypothetical protein
VFRVFAKCFLRPNRWMMFALWVVPFGFHESATFVPLFSLDDLPRR